MEASKKDDVKTDQNNNRPISVTSCLGKLRERKFMIFHNFRAIFANSSQFSRFHENSREFSRKNGVLTPLSVVLFI